MERRGEREPEQFKIEPEKKKEVLDMLDKKLKMLREGGGDVARASVPNYERLFKGVSEDNEIAYEEAARELESGETRINKQGRELDVKDIEIETDFDRGNKPNYTEKEPNK